MIPVGHLGPRTSALLDGQLSADETERAWAHVHTCHTCRDQVEREGWLKTRLAGLAYDCSASAPDSLKGSLKGSFLGGPPLGATPSDCYLEPAPVSRRRQNGMVGMAALGGGAVGAAVMGVLALGVAAPADAPTIDRRGPASITQTQVTRPVTPAEGSTPSLAGHRGLGSQRGR